AGFTQLHQLGVVTDVDDAKERVVAHAHANFSGGALQVLDVQQAACGSVEQGRQRFVEDLFGRQTAGVQVGETAREQVLADGRQQPLVQHAPDAFGAVLAIRDVGGQE